MHKKCPFCGGEAEYQNDTGPNDDFFDQWIECTKCGAKADLDVWDKRVEDASI